MGIALAPDPALEQDDPNAPPKPKPPTATPLPTTGGGVLGLAPQPLAPSGAAAPNGPSAPPVMTAPMTAPVTAPAPTVAAPSAPVDRVKLATDVFNQSAESTAPAYAAAQRDTVHNAAALGQLASGGLRTRTGTLALERERDLDQMRQKLVTDATQGSIADATTAYQQALAGSQQNLASELGHGQLDVAKGGLALETAKTGIDAALQKAGLTGLLDGQETLAAKQQKIQEAVTNKTLSQEDAKIALAQLSQQTSANQGQQQIDLAKEGQTSQTALQQASLALQTKLGLTGLDQDQQKIEIAKQQAQVQADLDAKRITIAEAQQKLAELSQAQQNTIQTGQLALATTGQAADIAARLQGLSLDQAKLELDKQVQTGQLTIAQANQALAQKQEADQHAIAQGQLGLASQAQQDQEGQFAATHEMERQRQNADRALAQEQVTNQAAQFGASQAQQLELAKLSDAIQNKQVDAQTAQGKNALLLELARIMGGPSGTVDHEFIDAIAASLGLSDAPVDQNPGHVTVPPGTQPKDKPTT